MRIVIIANPVSGGGRAYRWIQNCAQNWEYPDWELKILATRGPDHAGELVQELLQDPPDLLGICGGDGTVNEVASKVPHPPCPVALLPAGTANVVARELGTPLNPARALRAALKMRAVRHVDLGALNGGARRFLFVAGIGFDAYVVANVRPDLKRKFGMAAYAAAILSCLRSYSFPEFQVIVGGKAYTATSCLACNAKSYGGGLVFCPNAEMSDGMLDVLILEGNQRLALAAFLFQAWCGKPANHDHVHRLRARSLRIEGGAGVLVQADGELACGLPLEISLTDAIFPLVIP
jgi:YegS/Rv2252/BmrU family lipid kinase